MATTSLPSSPPPVNLWMVLSESKRVINANARHFLALSFLFVIPSYFFDLFVLPYYFSVTVNQSFVRFIADQSASSLNRVSLLRRVHGDQPPRADADTETIVPLLLSIAYNVVITVFDILAIGSITYSMFQGFYGRPLKLISAVKSSFTSFFPLLATLVSINFIFYGISLILRFGVFLLTQLIKLIVPGLEVNSSYLQALSIIVMIISIVIEIKLSVDWILAWVVVVVESVWGLTPLKRSNSLIKGRKGVSLSLVLFFAVAQSIIVLLSTIAASSTTAFFVIQIVITSPFLTLLTLYDLAAATVMYIYCKAVHGELAWDVMEESAGEYVRLPFDDNNV